MKEQKEILTVAEVAKMLGVHANTVYDHAGAGELPHNRIGRRLVFSRAAILRWAEAKGRAA